MIKLEFISLAALINALRSNSKLYGKGKSGSYSITRKEPGVSICCTSDFPRPQWVRVGNGRAALAGWA